MNVNIETNLSDNPEDHSLETTRVSLSFTAREMERLNELRGQESIAEYMQRVVDADRAPEHIEEAMKDHEGAMAFPGHATDLTAADVSA